MIARRVQGGSPQRPGEPWALHLVLIAWAVVSVFPVLWLVSTSFKPAADVYSSRIEFIPRHFTLENYRYLVTMKGGLFFTWLANSAIVALLTTAAGIFLAATAAFAFSRFRFWGRSGLLFSFLLTQMFPGALLIVPLYNLMKGYGLLNRFAGLVLAYTTVALPFCVWMLKNYFDTIPRELDEAARADGMGPWGTFYRIILPLSVPGLAVTAFYSFLTAWNEFMYALAFMSGEQMYTLPVGLRTFIFQFRTDWHYVAAGAVLITFPVLVFFFIAQRYLVSGLTAGAVKE